MDDIQDPPRQDKKHDLFEARRRSMAPRETQDLMSWPFFSLAKTPRLKPIDFRLGKISLLVEATGQFGIATIWDADVLIWAASQISAARKCGLGTSRRMATTPYEILNFIGRGDSSRDYHRLRAALNRLQETTVTTSIRPTGTNPGHPFSWINSWHQQMDAKGRCKGIELTLSDWVYNGVTNDARMLTLDPGYFDLAGGLERWLYRVVRKHGGRQQKGWQFDLRHLHLKSGCLSPFNRFAFELRDIVERQSLPGYELGYEVDADGRVSLNFEPVAPAKTSGSPGA